MAVITWKETGAGDELSIAFGSGQFAEAEATRTFLARVDKVSTAKREILLHPKCPKLGQPHPEAPLSLVDNVRVFRRRDSNWWLDVVAQYASNLADEQKTNPLERPLKVEWSTQRVRVLTQYDRKGRPMLNTAGELMAPVERNRSLFVADCEKLVAQVPQWVPDYEDAINADAVKLRGLTFPKHTLMFDGLQIGDREKEHGVRFYRFRFRLTYKRDTWLLKRLSTGFNELIVRRDPIDLSQPNGPKHTVRFLLPIFISGERAQTEQLLDKSGRWIEPRPPETLPPGQPAIDVSRVEILTSELDDQLPFAKLPLK